MHIPDTLSVVQYEGCILNCIRYVNFFNRKQETVNILEELALTYPELYTDSKLPRPCVDVAFSQDRGQQRIPATTVNLLTEHVPNTPSKEWQILGSNGHDCHLIHPVWGIWTLSNNEVLYLQASKPLTEQSLQFYVKDGILYLGIESEIKAIIDAEVKTPKISLRELTEDDIGSVILQGKQKYLVLECFPELQAYALPSFNYEKIAKVAPTYYNGYQYREVEIERTGSKYPTLAMWGATQVHTVDENLPLRAQQINRILEDRLQDLLQEVFQIRKKVVFAWERLLNSPQHVPYYLYDTRSPSMLLTDALANILQTTNIAVLETRLQISIAKQSKNQYELTIAGNRPEYSATFNFESLVAFLTQELKIQEVSFEEGYCMVWMTPY